MIQYDPHTYNVLDVVMVKNPYGSLLSRPLERARSAGRSEDRHVTSFLGNTVPVKTRCPVFLISNIVIDKMCYVIDSHCPDIQPQMEHKGRKIRLSRKWEAFS